MSRASASAHSTCIVASAIRSWVIGSSAWGARSSNEVRRVGARSANASMAPCAIPIGVP